MLFYDILLPSLKITSAYHDLKKFDGIGIMSSFPCKEIIELQVVAAAFLRAMKCWHVAEEAGGIRVGKNLASEGRRQKSTSVESWHHVLSQTLMVQNLFSFKGVL